MTEMSQRKKNSMLRYHTWSLQPIKKNSLKCSYLLYLEQKMKCSRLAYGTGVGETVSTFWRNLELSGIVYSLVIKNDDFAEATRWKLECL